LRLIATHSHMNKNNNTGNSIIDVNDLKTVYRIVAKNWYITVGLFFISLFASFIYSYKLDNVYSVQTQLLSEKNEQVNEQSIIGENFGSYYNWWQQSNSENTTAMRVFKSYDLIQNAVSRLNLDVSYFIVGRLKKTEVYENVPFEVDILAINPLFYEHEIDFKAIDIYSYQLNLKINGEEIIKEGFFDREFVDADIKLIIKNKNLSKENVEEIKYKIIVHDLSTLVYKFQSAITVENIEETNILQINVEDVIPERAQSFLDTLTTVYIENSLKNRFDLNANTLKYIEKQMAEVTSVLNGIEDTLQLYKENKGILDLGKEEEDYFAKMSYYDNQSSKLSIELGALNSLERYIIEDKDPQFLPPDVYIVSSDAFLKQSATELYTLQIQENEKLNKVTYQNNAILEGKQRIKKLKNNLLTYITNSKIAIDENRKDIQKQINIYASNIKSIPKKQRDLLSIQRDFEVNQKMYLFLLEKKSNTIISRAGILPKIKVIEAARNVGIVRPDKNKIRMFFIMFGFVLAVIIVFIREVLFNKIENVEELKKYTTLPILGEIVFSPLVANCDVVVDKESKSAITESFRTVRTNIQYMAIGEGSKVLIVTSNNPGEGKTFTSLNTGAILAKAGKRVLVLELDLHKPKIQTALNMDPDVGVSTILIGKTSIKESIKETVIENMHVLLSGPLPPNPSEMILRKEMDEIFEYAKLNYDYVIIDTPPIRLISDALVLMKYADLTIFVLNSKFANKENIQNVIDVINVNHLKHFGFVLNGVKLKRSKYYYNKYLYGYGYGYGYGLESTKKQES